jgi:hypothetical protein
MPPDLRRVLRSPVIPDVLARDVNFSKLSKIILDACCVRDQTMLLDRWIYNRRELRLHGVAISWRPQDRKEVKYFVLISKDSQNRT